MKLNAISYARKAYWQRLVKVAPGGINCERAAQGPKEAQSEPNAFRRERTGQRRQEAQSERSAISGTRTESGAINCEATGNRAVTACDAAGDKSPSTVGEQGSGDRQRDWNPICHQN